MPICPKCKAEIKHLLAYSEVVNNFEIDINGEPFCFGNDNIEGYTTFECPECNEDLNFNEEEAIIFLRDKDELQKLVAEKIKKDETSKIK